MELSLPPSPVHFAGLRRTASVPTAVWPAKPPTIPVACWRRNARQVVAIGRGAGSSPRRRRVVRIAAAETCTPEAQQSSDALVVPAGILRGQADDQLLDVLVQRWSSGLVRVAPGTGDEASVPVQQRLRPDEETRPA
jgi:hypothetical protein